MILFLDKKITQIVLAVLQSTPAAAVHSVSGLPHRWCVVTTTVGGKAINFCFSNK